MKAKLFRSQLGYIKRYLKFYRLKTSIGFAPSVFNAEQTIERLISSRCSLSRFGDGEFRCIRKGHPLDTRLVEVLSDPVEGHEVAIPYPYIDLRHLTRDLRLHWIRDFFKSSDVLQQHLCPERTYLDSTFTRFYLSYRDRTHSQRLAEKIRSIWKGRDILVVEGSLSRLGVFNNLFSDSNSVRRILCPPIHAFLEYDKILETCKRHGQGRLILLALGYTATILAYDLAISGLEAIDLGHVDDEYEWLLKGLTNVEEMRLHYLRKREPDALSKEQEARYHLEIIECIDRPDAQ